MKRLMLHGEQLESRHLLAGDLVISEFLASNDNGIRDQDYERPDWIEIFNAGDRAANLRGWHLTDDADELNRWEFPDVAVDAGQRLIVFASGKDRVQPGSPLHTDFQLSTSGEYLALVEPDGVTVAFDFGPQYPTQIPDVSFGMPQGTEQVPLIEVGGDVRLLVPTTDQGGDTLGQAWTAEGFDDSTWIGGVTGVGYERTSGYDQFIATSVEADMYEVNPTVYLRMPFTVEDPSSLFSLILSVQYDDGYVAYLNGVEVARRNAPDDLAWNSKASEQHRDRLAREFEDADISPYIDLLHTGENVLAIHALNDDVRGSDFLMVPRLTAGAFGELRVEDRNYFVFPSPGDPNGEGTTTSLVNVRHSPPIPSDENDLYVTVKVDSTGPGVAPVTLHYRVMFGDETSVPMRDDGNHGDDAANDGVFGAVIPASESSPGQMVRYRITAGQAPTQQAQSPVFWHATETQQYHGTVVADPSINSNLPVMHLFVEDTEASQLDKGSAGAFFYDGEFYDNIHVDGHGHTTRGYPKKSHDIFFPRDHRFRLADDLPRAKDINILTNWGDAPKVRNTIAYGTYRNAGTPAHLAFPVRVQQNGEFFAVYDFVEDGDDEFLEREGLDPRGALYKMDSVLDSATVGAEKKTRTEEDHSDLQTLIDGLDLTGAERTAYLFDHVNIAAMANYLASLVITGETDCCHRNYYAYRDTDGSGQWQYLPWDVDKSFGRGGTFDEGLFVQRVGLFQGRGNRLITALYDTPAFREMYLRRLRTLMDQLLQPPGTPANELKIEPWIDDLAEQLAPDMPADIAAWGSIEAARTWPQNVEFFKSEYFPARRVFLYHALTRANGGQVLQPQTEAPELRFEAMDVSPDTGNQDEEFIELTNPHALAVDISGWQLRGGVRHTFHPGTVIPAGGSLYLSPNVNAFRARSDGPRGGQGLNVQGNYEGHLSNLGEIVELTTPNGTLVASVTTPSQPTLTQQVLRISEIMYHPADPPTGSSFDDNEFEFVELINISETETVDLEQVAFTQGIRFQFSTGTLAPGERTIIVHNQDAFETRYGTKVRVAGQFQGSLSNAGERLKLEDASRNTILDFVYADGDPWPERADGIGASLELTDAAATPVDQLDKYYRWRGSIDVGGSPAGADSTAPGVVINEVLTNGDRAASLSDSIELFNTTADAIDMAGWYLSDSSNDLIKYGIPAGTIIQPWGYVTFDEADLNPTPADPALTHFALNGARGDDVWLTIVNESGEIASFVDDVHFGAAAEGVSLGRVPDGTGRLIPLTSTTLGGANASSRVGSVIISEVQYHSGPPTDEALAIDPALTERDLEYVELFNTTNSAMELTQWRLRKGIEFDFEVGTQIGPGQTLVLVPFDVADPSNALRSAAFRAHYGMGETTVLVGGYRGRLGNGGQTIQLQRPGESPADEPSLVPRLLEDEVLYDDRSPWPTETDGAGSSLSRRTIFGSGNVAASWESEKPTPGTTDLFRPEAGDSNLDRVFNQLDIVITLQGGKYLTGSPASFAQGDWNQDGLFDQVDVVAALFAGNYLERR